MKSIEGLFVDEFNGSFNGNSLTFHSDFMFAIQESLLDIAISLSAFSKLLHDSLCFLITLSASFCKHEWHVSIGEEAVVMMLFSNGRLLWTGRRYTTVVGPKYL